MARLELSNDKKGGIAILVIILVMLLAGLGGLYSKIRYEYDHPFEYHMNVIPAKEAGKAEKEQEAGEGDDYTYIVDISKHWVNDPGVPLQTYGAQYDNTIKNDSEYDIVDWSVVIIVPERNITIDSSWNGDWEYDKKNDEIAFSPDDRIETIRAGDFATFGAVMISKELMDFTDVIFTGRRYRPITHYAIFWMIMILMVVWITSAVAYILYIIRDENYKKNARRLNNVISQTMSTFANFIDAKDRYTKGHSARVSYYSQKIAEKLGMNEDEVRDIGYIGLMHDCGKLAIPGQILNKPGKLTEEEFDLMKTHTTNGDKMLKDFTAIEHIRDGALYHHERYDGEGYMSGLSGENIPLVARIIGVADALDAMNSDRIYRGHLSREVILKELSDNKGTQFDPGIAQIMIDMINDGEVWVGDGEKEEHTEG